MKKLFPLSDPKKAPERVVEAIKGDVSKYVKRERKKKVPEGVDFWDFDCKVGPSEAEATAAHVAEISKRIDSVKADGSANCFVEIHAKPGKRTRRV